MSAASAEQLDFLAGGVGRSAAEMIRLLNDGAPVPVLVKFTRNRVTMVSVSFSRADRVVVRMHEGFLAAPGAVVAALAAYVRSRDAKAWRVVAAHARSMTPPGDASRPARRLRTKGRVYDLGEILREVTREFFDKPVRCRIGWGRRGTAVRRRRRSIRFGSWSHADRVIRVHPALDDERVPRDFVRYIVYHELLHAVVPHRRVNGRRYDHGPEFQSLERRFPGLERMQATAQRLVNELE